MGAILTILIIAIVILVVLTICGLGEISLLLGAGLILACIAYVINKLMNIEDKLDTLLQQSDFDPAQNEEK